MFGKVYVKFLATLSLACSGGALTSCGDTCSAVSANSISTPESFGHALLQRKKKTIPSAEQLRYPALTGESSTLLGLNAPNASALLESAESLRQSSAYPKGNASKNSHWKLNQVDRDFWRDYVHDGKPEIADVSKQRLKTKFIAEQEIVESIMDKPDKDGAEDFCWKPPQVKADGVFVRNYMVSHHNWAPIDAKCPSQCPFTQYLAQEVCYKACVHASHCKALHPYLTFADEKTLQCSPPCGHNATDYVIGCLVCSSPGICQQCSFWRTLRKGGRECKDYWTYVWVALHSAAMALVGVLVLFCVYLLFRKIVNPGMLTLANVNRQLCKPWKYSFKRNPESCPPEVEGTVEVQQFPLTTKTHKENVAGIGFALYFRWSHVMLFFSIVLTVLLYLTFNYSLEYVALMGKNKLSEGSSSKHWKVVTDASDCKRKQTQLIDRHHSLAQSSMFVDEVRPGIRFKKLKTKVKVKTKAKMPLVHTDGTVQDMSDVPAGDQDLFPRRMAIVVAFSYLVLIFLSIWYSKKQAEFERMWHKEQKPYSAFAVLASGLPPTETNPSKLREFFQGALSNNPRSAHQVIGVSIAYYFTEETKKVLDYFDRLKEQVEGQALQAVLPGMQMGNLVELVEDQEAKFGAACREPMPTLRTNALEFVVNKLMPRDFIPESNADDDAGSKHDESWEEAAKRDLIDMRGSGLAYVVLASECAREDLLQLSGMVGPNGEDPVLFKACDTEPVDVMWNAHGHVPSKFAIGQKILKLFSMVLFWAALFTPYACYKITAEAVPGGEMGSASDFVLGTLIGIGNQFVTMSIDENVKVLGILNRESRKALTMAMVFLTGILNVGLDVGIVLFALRGLSLNLAMNGTLDQSHYDRVMAKELYALIVPGYLITPYLTSPIVSDVLPRLARKTLIRSTNAVSKDTAEQKYMCEWYDLSWNYADMLTNFTVCVPLLYFQTHTVYSIMGVLVCCNLLTYSIDHFRLLRATSVTPHLTTLMDIMFSYMWAIPLGMLGIIAIHWSYMAGFPSSPMVASCCQLLFIPVHAVVYIGLIRWSRRPKGKSDSAGGEEVSYDAVKQEHWSRLCFANYFNTNPVQVLQSWLLPDRLDAPSERHIVPTVLGKEHLMLLDPEVAQEQHLKEAMRLRFEMAFKNDRAEREGGFCRNPGTWL
jgi:hypothetical protein